MAKSRRNVKFQHRFQGADGVFTDGSNSTPTSPVKMSLSIEALNEKNPGKDSLEIVPEATEYEKKKQTFITRTIWTLVMIGVFFGGMAAGHLYILAIVTVVQVVTFKEVIAIANVPSREKRLQFTKGLNWYFLATTMFYLYGESVIYYFKRVVVVDAFLGPISTHHRFLSFMLYCFGFVFFVATLKKGHYKFQFTQFAWTHMSLLLVVVQAQFIINNIFEGMIWFFLPVSLVITNDIFAYICGITFGRTPLIKISPKKTVEGFVGAWIWTIIIGLGLTNLLMRSKYFICPVRDLGSNVWTGLECTPNPVFIPHEYVLPIWLRPMLWGHTTMTVAPMQFHILAMATFASLIAPFGGFFASGLKRSFKIKDFGETIPGHGGITDRMDCQFIMGFFSYMYYQSFIATYTPVTVGGVLETVITSLSLEEQLEVAQGIQKYLVGQGVVNEKILECWNGFLNNGN